MPTAQLPVLDFGGVTTDATPTELFIDAAGTQRLELLDDTSTAFHVEAMATRSDGKTKAWRGDGGLAKRGSGPGTVVFVGTPDVSFTYSDSGLNSVDVEVFPELTSGALGVRVTGQAGWSWSWAVRLRTVRVG